MSTTIQNMKDIGPMAGGDGAKNESDPVKADYEEGKRFLNNGNLGQVHGAGGCRRAIFAGTKSIDYGRG